MGENWTFRSPTVEGVLVEVEQSPDGYKVWLDGNQVEVVGRVQVFRDGGTRVFPLAGGLVLTLPHRLRSANRTPHLTSPEEER